MITITCRIPEDVDARLETMARERRVSKSRVVRSALDRMVGKSARSRKADALSLVGALAGSLHGPKDLSTNRTFLDDLGD